MTKYYINTIFYRNFKNRGSMRGLLLLACLLSYSIQLSAQKTGIFGKVMDTKGQAVSSATVGIMSTGIGTFTDEQGYFHLNVIPEKGLIIKVSAVGFHPKEIPVKASSDSVYFSIELESTTHQMDEMVVTGTMKEISVYDSPVKVNLVSGSFLEKNSSNNLMDAVKYINGLYTQVDCAVCGTSNIRINGMEGPYTSVLIDGMPVMGALASVYGLSGINPSVIRNLEIIKGPNSTLYGSQAMGGVINIITENPRAVPRFTLSSSTSSHSEHDLNFSVAPEIGESASLLSGSIYYQDRFIDQNDDNFADITQNTRISLFNKWEVYRPSGKELSLAAKIYYEDRMGGTENYNSDLRGSTEIYGESIFTNRFELFGTYELPVEPQLHVDASFTYHDQDSYYGEYHYVADQQTLFSNFIWTKDFDLNSGMIIGLSTRYDKLNQLFNGTRLPGGSEDERFVPGIFAQADHRFSDAFRGLVGLRADHHKDHGLIYSPRVNIKFNPSDHTTVRMNVGTGFRIVNLFTEEHESMTGSRQVVVAEKLDPERSVNAAINWNQIIDIGPSILNMDVDLYYTRFSNQIIPDYSTQNQIIYQNLDGYSVSRGVAVSLAHNFLVPLTYTIGITIQDVFTMHNNIRRDLPFSADYNGVMSITYTFLKPDVTLDYTSRLVGKMKLPDYPDRDNYSKVFTEHNLKVTKRFDSGFEFFVGSKNIFDYIQDEPIIAADQPFSDEFATDYVYGPIQGRRLIGGVKITLD